MCRAGVSRRDRIGVKAEVNESRQLATENVWVEIVENALAQDRIDAARKLTAPPL